MNLTIFEYALVRFVPDPVRGEQINLGVIVLAEDSGFARAQFLPKVRLRARMKLLRPKSTADGLLSAIERLQQQVVRIPQLPLFANEHGDQGEPFTRMTLQALTGLFRNQLQFTDLKPYRAASLSAAVDELYDALVAPPASSQPTKPHAMTLAEVRERIADTARHWTSAAVRLKEASVEEAVGSRHYADLWLQADQPLAALVAIPEEPGERPTAWLLRDSIPTIVSAFRQINPAFQTVAVFPPNGHEPSAFVQETTAFLGQVDGVLVTHLDHLAEQRSRIVPSLL